LMKKEHIQFKLKIDENKEPMITTDRTRLKQVFNNLIQNAFKFTNEGYVEIGYELKSEFHIRFFVKDTGIGIPEEKQDIIFDRFRQVDESIGNQYGGTGLGLAISKNLIILLGGEISVHSKPGQGSTFYIDLPMQGTNLIKTEMEVVFSEKEFAYRIPDLTNKQILVVEDDSFNYRFMESFLKQTKARILWAKDGIQALELFRNNNNIELILMDIRMPNMDGIEATHEMRRLNTKVPIIALTAYAFTDDREKSLLAGCNDYLSKPVRLEILVETLNKHLRVTPAKEN